jgi:predicted Zn-dependent protease
LERILPLLDCMKHLLPVASLIVAASIVSGSAATRITPPENRYSPAEDVKIGREAAADARRQLPLVRDKIVNAYVEDVGRRLVAAIRPELRHPNFRYQFQVVNERDVNAFALPGGPIFVNRGMLEAADGEGQIAGVLAHEISHVALRHGTAQASRARPYQLGGLAGLIVGSLVGGRTGEVIARGTQFGLATAFLRYGREFERQADFEGAQLMARAGYDPQDAARMFKSLERRGGPEWLSSHPNPGNRHEAINREASSLHVRPVRDTGGFERVQARLRAMPPAPRRRA